MRVTVTRPGDLDEASLARWRALQDDDPRFDSPYFAPELALAAADARGGARDDVRVAVLEEGGAVVGFFPYQKGSWGALHALGGLLSDHHGAVVAAGTTVDWAAVLRAAGASHWSFDHLVAEQAPAASVVATTSSPALDLSKGFDAWREGKKDSRRIGELDRKARKLAREVGPLRFEAHTADRDVFLRVVEWKSAQCVRTGALDYFGALPWTRGLVDRVWQTDLPRFAGVLSTLSAGDALVAANLGMRSHRAWHWWFPVYDHALARYSPGALLLLRVAEAAAASGARLLDLGKGDEPYKESFADTHVPLAEGVVARAPALAAAHLARLRAERWVGATLKASAPAQPLVDTLRALRRLARRAGAA